MSIDIRRNCMTETYKGFLKIFCPENTRKSEKAWPEILPESPKNLEDVKIEGAWQKTKQGGEEIVLHQEVGLRQRNFCDNRKPQFFGSFKNYYGNEIFKLAPPPFIQNYALCKTSSERILPVVWAFLGSKTENIYSKIFTNLSENSFEKFSVYLMPELIITDYETGVIAAVKKVFVASTHWGCWFHFSKCIFGKYQDFGPQKRYQDENLKKIRKNFSGF